MNDELYHHGVLGMRWGVHRNRTASNYARIAESSRGTSSALNSSSNAVKNASHIGSIRKASKASKEASTMSNQELQERINRMNLERNYTTLKSADTSAGRAYASEILSAAGNIAAITASVATVAAIVKNSKG